MPLLIKALIEDDGGTHISIVRIGFITFPKENKPNSQSHVTILQMCTAKKQNKDNKCVQQRKKIDNKCEDEKIQVI